MGEWVTSRIKFSFKKIVQILLILYFIKNFVSKHKGEYNTIYQWFEFYINSVFQLTAVATPDAMGGQASTLSTCTKIPTLENH